MPPNLDVYYGGADDDYTHRGGMSRAYGEFSRSGDSERSPYYHGRGNHDAAPPPHPPPATARRRGRPVASSNGGGKASNGRTVVDFEDFSTDAEKLSAILKLGDVEMHKHMLSADYYRFRKYLLLAPTVLSGLSIAIMGFVAASDVIEDRMKVGTRACGSSSCCSCRALGSWSWSSRSSGTDSITSRSSRPTVPRPRT